MSGIRSSGIYVSQDSGTFEHMRELRLYHQRQADEYRAEEKYQLSMFEGYVYDHTRGRASRRAADRAIMHEKFVTYLNAFFTADDTAEKDAAK